LSKSQEEKLVVEESLEQCRVELEDRTGKAADATPIVRLKTALASMRRELRSMDSRLGLALSMVEQRRQARDFQARQSSTAAVAQGRSGKANAAPGTNDGEAERGAEEDVGFDFGDGDSVDMG